MSRKGKIRVTSVRTFEYEVDLDSEHLDEMYKGANEDKIVCQTVEDALRVDMKDSVTEGLAFLDDMGALVASTANWQLLGDDGEPSLTLPIDYFKETT